MYAVYTKMEESPEQVDQPPPSVTIQGDADIQYDWLEEQAIAALSFLGKCNSEVSVNVVDDSSMSALHFKHSGVEGTTDVLTFDFGSDENAVRADIAICVDVASREVELQEHSLKEELLLYLVHGMLHCCGFDDHDEESHKKIHEEEDRVLAGIGVGTLWSSES